MMYRHYKELKIIATKVTHVGKLILQVEMLQSWHPLVCTLLLHLRSTQSPSYTCR